MHFYVYTRPDHADHGALYCSPDPIEYGQSAEGDNRYYVPCDPPKPPAPTIEDIRKKRNGLLFHTDWTQLPDSPLSAAMKAQYQVYRQALRDMTETENTEDIVFPLPPVSDA